MTLRFYDSKTQELREFQPLQPGKVGIYLCGPTVQSEPHVGHLRSALAYDQLRRWLTARGYSVTLVRNVTDIDDKVLANAVVRGKEWWALAYEMELEFNAAYRALRIAPPTYEPRATASIPEMLALIERLIANGFAYQSTDGSADVYFAASAWKNYGELTRQSIDDMAAATDADPRGKRDPRDFTLWKAAKPNEPLSASWDTRFGRGRPGWHIECSAMSTKYLGAAFDIHGGGIDLRFPHHENELAQSTAAGDPFANYWLHNGLVNVAGQKMSKSLGNSIFAKDLLAAGSALAVRFWLGSANYRSILDYSDSSLVEAQTNLDRIAGFQARAERFIRELPNPDQNLTDAFGQLPADFITAMDEDLNLPSALAAIFDAVRSGNSAIDSGDRAAAEARAAELEAMLTVLGINPRSRDWAEAKSEAASTHAALDSLIKDLIEQRRLARETKDFAKADQIRNQLSAAKIVLSDTADGTHWSISNG